MESVIQFALRIQALQTTARLSFVTISDEEVKMRLLQGVSPSLHATKVQIENDCMLKSKFTDPIEAQAKLFVEMSLEQMIRMLARAETVGAASEVKVPTSTFSTVVITCYNCGEVGHKANACSSSAQRVTYYKCGSEGHVIRECPEEDCTVLSTDVLVLESS